MRSRPTSAIRRSASRSAATAGGMPSLAADRLAERRMAEVGRLQTIRL